MSDAKPVAVKPIRHRKRNFTLGLHVKRILRDMHDSLRLTAPARDMLMDIIHQVVQQQSRHAAVFTRHANRKVMKLSDVKGAVALMFRPLLAARVNKRSRDALHKYKATKKKPEAAKTAENGKDVEKPAENGKDVEIE